MKQKGIGETNPNTHLTICFLYYNKKPSEHTHLLHNEQKASCKNVIFDHHLKLNVVLLEQAFQNILQK